MSDLLYHYTGIDAVEKILDGAKLWATHIAYLNDSREFDHGYDLLFKYVSARVKAKRSTDPHFDKTFKSLGMGRAFKKKQVEELRRQLKHDYGMFVSCLSTKGDDLSQWRGYAQGGYAIGFDRDALEAGATLPEGDDGMKPRLKDVVYDVADFGDDVTRILDEGLDDFPMGVMRPDSATYPQNLATLFEAVSRMKDKAFEGESEVRLMSLCAETFRWPSPTIGLIPRTDFIFPPEAVKKIVVGPSDRSDVKAQSIERFLDKHTPRRYRNVEVTESKVPYRAL